jgi:hypothetical protein
MKHVASVPASHIFLRVLTGGPMNETRRIRRSFVFIGLGLAALVTPTQLNAQDPFGFGRGVVGGALRQLNQGIPSPSSRPSGRRSSNNDGGGDDRSSSRSKSRNKESQEEQRALDGKNAAMARAEWQELVRTARLEQERNVDSAVKAFIVTLEQWHQALRNNRNANVRVSSGVSINQVTAGEVKKAVEDAYGAARLVDFERHAGEMWTRDRLMVRILRRAQAQLDPYFSGVGVKGTSMEDLKHLFDSAAKRVYARALETAEIIGVSYSFERFINTIYENSDRVGESLWTVGADGHYERLVSSAINLVPRNRFIMDDKVQVGDSLGLTRQFEFRFRARRALYDCLSSHYLEMVNGDGQKLLPAAIETGSTTGGGAEPRQQPRIAKLPGRDLVSTVAGEEEGTWRKAQTFVRETCLGTIEQIAQSSSSDQIKPIPARWNLAPRDGALNSGAIPMSTPAKPKTE